MELFADMLIVSSVILLTVIWDLSIADIFIHTWSGETMGDKLLAAAMVAASVSD